MVRWYAQQMTDIDVNLRTSRTDLLVVNISESLPEMGLPICGAIQLLRVLVDFLGRCKTTGDMAVRNSSKLSYFVIPNSSERCT